MVDGGKASKSVPHISVIEGHSQKAIHVFVAREAKSFKSFDTVILSASTDHPGRLFRVTGCTDVASDLSDTTSLGPNPLGSHLLALIINSSTFSGGTQSRHCLLRLCTVYCVCARYPWSVRSGRPCCPLPLPTALRQSR